MINDKRQSWFEQGGAYTVYIVYKFVAVVIFCCLCVIDRVVCVVDCGCYILQSYNIMSVRVQMHR